MINAPGVSSAFSAKMAKRFLAAVALAMAQTKITATTQMLRQQIHASRNERALHAQPTPTTKGIQIARATVRPEQTDIEAGLIANRYLRTAAEHFVTQMSGYAMIADQPLLMIQVECGLTHPTIPIGAIQRVLAPSPPQLPRQQHPQHPQP